MPDLVLGDFEQIVLLALLRCGDEAYGVPIWRELEARTGREISIAAVYKTLERLEVKGLVRSKIGEPTAERGGRAKRLYAVSPSGLRALRTSISRLRRLTAGLDEVLGT